MTGSIPSAKGKRKAEGAGPGANVRARWIVGVGASAGGLEAFTRLIKDLPPGTGMALVLVQHLDPEHESALVQLLSKATTLPVVEATNSLAIEPDHIYVIPPKAILSIAQGVLKLSPRQAGSGASRTIDAFFEALADDKRGRAIGVILSGTASDGTLGLEAIKAEGGITFAQDETARFDSMPRSAIAAGCVDFVLSPERIAKELARIARHPYVDMRRTGAANLSNEAARPRGARAAGTGGAAGENGLAKILLLLHNHSGVDFSLYKSTTVQRRIARRMVLNKLDGLDRYARFLRGNVGELDALYSDMLIGVTGFFRNPEAFEILKRDVFPKLISKRRADPLRVWVLGCSTGQEAYSLAMAYAEFSERLARPPKLQMFATDLNDAMLDRARAGLYAKTLVPELSRERLRRFFSEQDGGYRVNKPLRDAIVFARQNLLSDPPFSRMDLISCRNLLIYVEPGLQRSIMPMFHYALRPNGCLFLGISESIGLFTNLFEPVDKKHRIYFKKPGRTPALPKPVALRQSDVRSAKRPGTVPALTAGASAQREADRITLNRFAPVSVLVDADFQVLQFRDDTSLYLKPPTGQATLSVLKMAREGLMLPLRMSLNEASRKNKIVRKERLRVDQNGSIRTVNLEVVPLKNLKEWCFLVFFEEAHKAGLAAGARPAEADKLGEAAGTARLASKRESRRIVEAERDVAEMRDYAQSIQEQYEAANEELQASNEEVTSANEELQSLNEELETSKEEMESANEELTTLNEEMANRNAELNRLNSDLINLQTSIEIAVVLLDRNLTIRRFSPQAEKQFSLLATDVGRSLAGVRHNLDLPDLTAIVAESIDTVRGQDREVRDNDGRWYSLRMRPYLTHDNKVDGAVLALVDIDELKRSEIAAAAAREQADAVIRTIPDPLLVLNADLLVDFANAGFYQTFKLSPADVEGRSIFQLDHGTWNIPLLRQFLEDVLPRHSFFNDLEVMRTFERLGRRTMLVNARTLSSQSDEHAQILVGIRDVTEVLAYQVEVRRSELRYRRLFEAAQDGVLIVDPGTKKIVDANPFMAELLGYTHAELRGKELFEVGLFEERAASDATFRQLLAEGHIRHSDLPVITKQGTRRDVEFVASLYREDGEEIIQCNVRDIGDRKRAERQRN
jgi:two-component system CheB/CheR fusion protein